MSNIQSITPIGQHQTYDLEVDHPDHQFYLSNNVLTSNSHSITYSTISYHTAYLKAHYPTEFLAANLMIESAGTKQTRDHNILSIKNELRNRGIKVLPPDINSSPMEFTITDKDKILTGLNALKSVGEDAINNVIENRPYSSFQDFMAKVDSSRVRANTIQSLAASGAFSNFNISRRQICLYVADYRKKLTAWSKKHDPLKEEFVYNWKQMDEWSGKEIYALESKFMGESFSFSPRVAYASIFKLQHQKISDISSLENKTRLGSLAGILSNPFEITIKKEGKLFGKKMYKFNFEDFHGGSCSITVFPDALERLEDTLKLKTKKKTIPETFAMCFSGTVNIYNDQFGIVLSDIYNLELPPAIPADFKEKKTVSKEQITTKSLSDVVEEMISEGLLIDE